MKNPSSKNRVVRVGDRTIGAGRTFLIADVGSNHKQDLQLAFESIHAAAEAGADAVKFQSLQMKELYLDPSEDVKRLYSLIDLQEEWHAELKAQCEKRNVLFFSSPTYFGAVDLMEKLDVVLYKLASAQIGTFPQIVERVALTGKPVIMSTGLVTMGELEACVRIFDKAANPNFVILHCNSVYPTPYNRVNLPLMQTYHDMFRCPVGYSDHTEDIHIALVAVGCGASVIEKHFSLSLEFDTPDTIVALDPKGFSRLTEGVRAVEQALTPHSRIHIEPSEQDFKESVAYRLVLARPKLPGESFDSSDFLYLRNAKGIDCRDEAIVIEHFRACQALPPGKPLEWGMLRGMNA